MVVNPCRPFRAGCTSLWVGGNTRTFTGVGAHFPAVSDPDVAFNGANHSHVYGYTYDGSKTPRVTGMNRHTGSSAVRRCKLTSG